MIEYLVRWEIECRASTPEEAAKFALDCITNGTAKFFIALNMETLEETGVDLENNVEVNEQQARENKIEQAKEMLKSEGYFTENLWSAPDIDAICNDNNIEPLTMKQKIDFFEYVGTMHDASIGINWESLRTYLEAYLQTHSV